ncbi:MULTISPECIES: ABC transporter ATP-binding protein [Rhizobium/Agrobacterium group]|jgi:putative spermidine/putrescine transport system ATP-binding protein|uniref:ABC transporter ATP-binding protein n=1 Tax=Rhizobium/Agrobacterium group TaxID=227290 RepID=UPI00023A528F|nr:MULTISPECIES: ABC transporter ATP-binding protein [Rhizobium/Agrobacterium group]AHK04153.1 putrescine transport ATP-binding protein PotA [Agrobacterium tumefaciens LBA4213 (Ach5)]AKC09896.1 spermidine/putrescine ABC transporter ATPase [Agrobacterium tumefaciens]EHJ95697.1 spermidine/putrescine ABC transporter nucleotide-binding protein/ATPase [Agrobacterium tumefaciens 5A]MDP9562278.1 putative spermidine/putrescine transport system ATP-binding protein [Rhizobium nepotum]AYM19040.1 spermidi
MSDANYLSLQKVSLAYGNSIAVKDLDLDIRKGELLALLGPSGCGKTTTMRAIAGLMPVAGGRIDLDGTDITRVAANKRAVGLVFQSYALFPHLTVYENVAFGLKLKGMNGKALDDKVASGLKSVGLSNFASRKPAELSGGQQQRVALARSMVMEPKVLLLDEPLSNLDARLRLEMRTELQRVQKETGVTMIFVTHDQIEALALADRIVVMKGGKIEQIGTPEEIYNAPVSAFVADFVGFENIFALEGGALKTENGTTPLTGPVPSASGLAWRPRMVTLGSGPFQGTVRGTSFAGNTREYLLDTLLGPIKAETDAALTAHTIGDTLAFDLPVEKAASLKVFG